MSNFMQATMTLTGLTLEKAVAKLMEVLPPDAYKAVPGAAGLTDIDPAYLTQALTEVFGLAGIGWKYDYDPSDLEVRWIEKVNRKGEPYGLYEASVSRLVLTYRFQDDQGILWSDPIPANGGSENEQKGFAVRGALTNAIGACAAKLCWQLLVYQGKVDHSNASKLYAAAHKAEAGSGNGAKAATGGNGAKPSRKEPPTQPVPKQSQPKLEADPGFIEDLDAPAPAVEAPADHLIGWGARKGQKLGDQPVEWVTRLAANPSVNIRVEEQAAFAASVQAAKAFLAVLPVGA